MPTPMMHVAIAKKVNEKLFLEEDVHEEIMFIILSSKYESSLCTFGNCPSVKFKINNLSSLSGNSSL